MPETDEFNMQKDELCEYRFVPGVGGHRHWPPQSMGRAQALAHSVSGTGGIQWHWIIQTLGWVGEWHTVALDHSVTGWGSGIQWPWTTQSPGRAQALVPSVIGAGTGTGPLSHWGGHRHWPTQSLGWVGEWHTVAVDHSVTGVGG